MRGYCRVIIAGTLGRDPIPKTFPDKGVASSFSLATTYSTLDASGNKKDFTEWHRITAVGPLAETCNRHLVKGSKVIVEGTNRTRSWYDQRYSTERFITEVRIDKLEILSSPQRSGQDSNRDSVYDERQNHHSINNHGFQEHQDNYAIHYQEDNFRSNNNASGYPQNNQPRHFQNNQHEYHQNNFRGQSNRDNRGYSQNSERNPEFDQRHHDQRHHDQRNNSGYKKK